MDAIYPRSSYELDIPGSFYKETTGAIMISIIDKIKNSTLFKNANFQSWHTFVVDHTEYLLTSAAELDIPPRLFILFKNRPVYLLRELGIAEDDIHIIVIVNQISLSSGFSKTQNKIKIPKAARMQYVKTRYKI